MDIRLLADPTRCPDCGIALPGTPPECPACGLPLRGDLADRLWRVSVAAAGLLEERTVLIGRLRVAARVPAGALQAIGGEDYAEPKDAPPQPQVGPPSVPAWLPPPRAYEGAMADRARGVRDPSRPRQMQRVLLGLGVLLLAIAALIFTVVAWGRVGIGGRSAILAGVTAAAAWASSSARRRELPGTAESLALLATAFLLLDAYGARSANLAGLAGTPADVYWATVAGLVAALGGALWRAHPLRSVRNATVLAAQVPLLIVGDRMPDATFAALLCVQGAAAVMTARRLTPSSGRLLAGLGGAIAYLGGLISAAEQAYAPSGSGAATAPGMSALGVAAVLAAYVARDARELAPLRTTSAAAATAALLAGAFAPFENTAAADDAPMWGAVLLVVAIAVLCAPRPAAAAWRGGPWGVVGVGFLAALAALGEPLRGLAAGAFGWLDDPWSGEAHGSARALLAEPWVGSGAVPVTLALLTSGAALAAWRLRSGLAVVAGGALGTAAALAALAAPVAADLPYLTAVLGYVAVGGALLAAAAGIHGRAVEERRAVGDEPHVDKAVLTAAGLAAAGTCAAALGLSWATATSTATAWALVVGLAAAAAAHLAGPRTNRPAPVAAGALLLVGEAVVIALLADARGAVAGFVGVATASALAVAAGRLRSARRNERLALECSAIAGAVAGLAWTVPDRTWSSNALLVAGTAAALVAVLPDRRPAAWLSGVLVTASSWLRLAEADVETPEAYTTGPALALLLAGWWNRRGTPVGDHARSSWAAYAPGLTMGLLPSLVRVADDAGDPGTLPLDRPLLLGLAALVVLLVGVRAKLQAPLLTGAAVLAADAVILLAPYAAALPRWAGIGGAGVLLLGLGATYEKRIRDLRRLKDGIEALG